VPDDVEDETVEKAADGGEKTEGERLLMVIHLNLVQNTVTTTFHDVSFRQRPNITDY